MEHILVPIAGVLAVFGSPVLIVWLALTANNRKRELIHETLNKSIDSGHPLPENLTLAFENTKPIRTQVVGILLLTLAIGLGVCLYILLGIKFASIAAVPLFVGLGFLLIHIMDKRDARENS